MTFGTAIDALKNGLIVRRKEWNETKFVIKQIPAHINEDIIPNIILNGQECYRNCLSIMILIIKKK